MKYRYYFPIKIGNMLFGCGFGLMLASLSETVNNLLSNTSTCYMLFVFILMPVCMLLLSGERAIYGLEKKQRESRTGSPRRE